MENPAHIKAKKHDNIKGRLMSSRGLLQDDDDITKLLTNL